MMTNLKKPVGVFIIGFAITFLISIIPIIIFGDHPITGSSRSVQYNNHLSGDEIIKYIIGIGLPITLMFTLKHFNINLRKIVYPSLIGCMLGILFGLIFPVRVYDTFVYYDFNPIIFWTLLSIGIFISLISLGMILIKK